MESIAIEDIVHHLLSLNTLQNSLNKDVCIVTKCDGIGRLTNFNYLRLPED